MASKTVEAVLFPGINVRVERVSDSSDVLMCSRRLILTPPE